jgi:integrase
MDFDDYLDEFATDWRLAGRAAATAKTYCAYLRQLHEAANGDVTLLATKRWLETAVSAQTARGRGRAVRAFGRWAVSNEGPDWSWWPKVPLSSVAVTPQPTATIQDYERAMKKAGAVRDRLVIELLWSSGLRVSELASVNGQ